MTAHLQVIKELFDQDKVMECYIRWSALHNYHDLNSVDKVWDELDRSEGKAVNQCSTPLEIQDLENDWENTKNVQSGH